MVVVKREKGGATLYAAAVRAADGAVTKWSPNRLDAAAVDDVRAGKTRALLLGRPHAGTVTFHPADAPDDADPVTPEVSSAEANRLADTLQMATAALAKLEKQAADAKAEADLLAEENAALVARLKTPAA